MGSLALLKTAKDYYFLGLWLADGYWWSSSFGLSSTNIVLIDRFKTFLKKLSPTHTIKERVYRPNRRYKGSLTARHIYINSRFLAREFQKIKRKKILEIPYEFIPSYFAGRIDGDGHVDIKHRTGIRVVYSDKMDAIRDLNLLKRLQDNPASLYRYHQANTWVLYFRKPFLKDFISKIAKYSYKLRAIAP